MALTKESVAFTIDLFVPCDSEDGQQVMHIYRYVKGGICGPFSEHRPCKSHDEAIDMAREMGYIAVGKWNPSPSGSSSIEALRIG